jgi:hypothetical protein
VAANSIQLKIHFLVRWWLAAFRQMAKNHQRVESTGMLFSLCLETILIDL